MKRHVCAGGDSRDDAQRWALWVEGWAGWSPEPYIGCAKNTELQPLTREGADGHISSLGLHHIPPAQQVHSGSFRKGRTAKNKF